MILIPWLSIVVFVLAWAPFIFLGIKKGWIYALIFSFILWIITTLFLVANFLLYDVWLWKAYRGLFLDDKIKVDLDLAVLSKYFKTKILLMFLGAEMILIYPLTFLMMILVNKFTYDLLGPLTESVDKNNVRIISHRNVRTSRIIGGSILGVFSIFSASSVASAINTFTIPNKNRNFFTIGNDYLNKIYTFGLTNNSKNPEIITDFLENIDQPLYDAVAGFAGFSAYESTNDNIFPETTHLAYLRKNIEIFKDLFTNDEASRAIFNAILSNLATQIDPLAYDDDTARNYLDANDNVIGYNKSSYQNDIQALESYLNANVINDLFPPAVLQLVYQVIMERVTPFAASLFTTNVSDNEENTETFKQILDERVKELADIKTILSNLVTERHQIFESLSLISGGVVPSDWEDQAPVNFVPTQILRTAPGTGTFFTNVTDEEQKLRAAANQNDVKNKASEAYNNYVTSTLTPQETKMQNASNFLNGKRNELASEEKALSALQTQLAQKQGTLASNQKALVDIDAAIKSFNDNIDDLNQEIVVISASIDAINSEIILKNQSKISLENDVRTLGQEIADLDQQLAKLGAELDKLDPVNDKSEYDRVNQEIKDKTNTRTQKQSDYDTKNRELTNLITAISELNQQLSDLADQKSVKENEIAAVKAKIVTKQGEKQALENANNILVTDISELNNVSIPNQEAKVNKLKTDVADSQKVYDQEFSLYQVYLTEANQKKSVLDQATKLWEQLNNVYELQKNVVDQMISQYDAQIIKIGTINDDIRNKVIIETRLEKIDPNNEFIPPAKTWSKPDDSSIYYIQQKILFSEAKQRQLVTIYNTKKTLYESMLNKFEQLMQQWTTKEGGQ